MLFLKHDEMQPLDFAAAKSEWDGARAKMRKLQHRHNELTQALHLARIPEGGRDELIAHLYAANADEIARATKYPRRVQMEIEDLLVEMDEFEAEANQARDRYRIAADREAERIAASFENRHREAVSVMISALERLSAALGEEKTIRAEFAALSPVQPGEHLFNIGRDIQFADLSRWDSPAATWARAISKKVSK
jgi:seryl-tRNA synthetase